MKDYKNNKAYERAKERVEKEKGFYSHLTAYIIINIALLFLNADFGEPDLNNWFRWNMLLTPALWGIGLLFHGISVFGKTPSFGKKWEEKKIKELMDKDDF
ncbi:2TM domain-containing protein [Aquimarina gracilis]|uniref:2TM domain-containing protein n=1 Tax=Aquimarina gracilis TaxID=874422 RepID=A0ABU5ZWJ5_9FLAO|nr:2TM domain-containing protein [Aquimarina gracilis]MEB3346238.1 2TM domain-containing protein [Aquimarina gracilis]